MSEQIIPEVGMGATLAIGSDRAPYTIVEIGKNKDGIVNKVIVQADSYKLIAGSTLSEHQEYEFKRNTTTPKIVFTLRKNGRWVKRGDTMRGGFRIGIGHRDAHYDPSF